MPGVPESAILSPAQPPISQKVCLIPPPEPHRASERIAIVGAGATGTYCLNALLEGQVASEVVVFEASSEPGPGLAYAPQLNDLHALSNIAGFEIPPLLETLNAWAVRQPQQRLEGWEIADRAADDRAFLPRVVLGAWLGVRTPGIKGATDRTGAPG